MSLVTSTLSIVYPPLSNASVYGYDIPNLNQVAVSPTKYFSSLGGATIPSGVGGMMGPLVIDTNLNNNSYVPQLLSTLLSTNYNGASVKPVVRVSNLNTSTILPAFQH